ncbi:MAG: hypothetical protein QG670_2217, partial [Thermoproteota archaeon]|nr:hypothetical protein [Thermoproteota archaeon]
MTYASRISFSHLARMAIPKNPLYSLLSFFHYFCLLVYVKAWKLPSE